MVRKLRNRGPSPEELAKPLKPPPVYTKERQAALKEERARRAADATQMRMYEAMAELLASPVPSRPTPPRPIRSISELDFADLERRMYAQVRQSMALDTGQTRAPPVAVGRDTMLAFRANARASERVSYGVDLGARPSFSIAGIEIREDPNIPDGYALVNDRRGPRMIKLSD